MKETFHIPMQNISSRKNPSISLDQDDKNYQDYREANITDTENSVSTNFLTNTSLHGFKYLVLEKQHFTDRSHILPTVFWTLMIAVAIGTSGYFMYREFAAYDKNPIVMVTDSEEIFIDQVPFPAVTICNVNNIRRSKVEEFLRDAKGLPDDPKTQKARVMLNYIDHFCTSSPAFSRKFNHTFSDEDIDDDLLADDSTLKFTHQIMMEIFTEVAQTCKEMIPLCMWKDKVRPCDTFFHPVMTDYGYCCVFNRIPVSLLLRNRTSSHDSEELIKVWSTWNIKKNGLLLNRKGHHNHTSYPKIQQTPGAASGLSILLDPATDGYFCSKTDSVGFKMLLNLPIEADYLSETSIALRPQSEIFVEMTPHITKSIPQVTEYSVEKRKCYNREEFPLKFYKLYTQINCYKECVANETYNRCSCVFFHQPRDNFRSLCIHSQHECANHVQRNVSKYGVQNICELCLPSCEEIKYYSATTHLPIYNDHNIWRRVNPQWENASVVHIYFGVGRTYARLRSELFSLIDLIACAGGLLGLCLGFSGLSLIEMIYFLLVKLCSAVKKKFSHEKNVVQQSPSNNIWTNTATIKTNKNLKDDVNIRKKGFRGGFRKQSQGVCF